jgi:hypothetical protein
MRLSLLTHIDSIAWVMKSFLLVFIPISIIFLLFLVVVVRGDDRCCGRMKEERVRNARAMRCISCADIFHLKKHARYLFTRSSSSSIKIQKGTSPKPNHSMKSVISSRRPIPLFSLSFRNLSLCYLSLVSRARKLPLSTCHRVFILFLRSARNQRALRIYRVSSRTFFF